VLCRSERDEVGAAPRRHRWLFLFGAIAIIAAHGVALQYLVSHAAISMTVVVGVLVLIVVKHLGLVGAALAMVRRLWRDPR
jgi:hypothetical protein